MISAIAVTAALALSGPPGQDRDFNPPGPRGGWGTNWENPPGARGGPGASPDRVFVYGGQRYVFTPRGAYLFNPQLGWYHPTYGWWTPARCWADADGNPPGPVGGPGTNWENPPGVRGGPGRSPDRYARCR